MSEPEETVQLLKKLEQQFLGISQTLGDLAARLPQPPTAETPRFLAEPQMAEWLGISKRAIQHRRLRGQIPSWVVQKVGPNWLYSVARYEEWLESLWPAPKLAPVAKGRKRMVRPCDGTNATITRLV